LVSGIYRGKTAMSDISAIASSALAMNQSRLQEQISMSILKMNAKAEQAVADMLTQNASRIEASQGNSSDGLVDLYA
jgi:hypothetical protein